MSEVIISHTQDDKLDELIEYMGSSVPAKLNELNAKIDGISSYYQEATLTGKEVQAQLVNTIKPESGKVTIGGVEYDNFKALHEKLDEKVSQVSDILEAKIDSVVNVSADQVVGGVKTFSSPPVSAISPTQASQVANKAYVDEALGSKLSVSAYDIDKQGFATKSELREGLNAKADGATTYNKTEVDSKLDLKANRDELDTKLNITTYNADKANFATKAEIAGAGAYLVEKGGDSKNGYRLYSDGYCEQWGVIDRNSDIDGNKIHITNPGYHISIPVTLYKPYKDTKYHIQAQIFFAGVTGFLKHSFSLYGLTATGFVPQYNAQINSAYDEVNGWNIYWRTSGYIR